MENIAGIAPIDRKLVFETPARVFEDPMRVVQTAELTHDDKIVVLRNWKRNLEKLLEDAGQRKPDIESRLAAVAQALGELHRKH